MTRTRDRDPTDRRTILKWAMLGGGAALARLFAGPLAHAAPTPKEQQAQGAFDRATRGMPACNPSVDCSFQKLAAVSPAHM